MRKGDKWWLYANSLEKNAEKSALARIPAKNKDLKSRESVDFSAKNALAKSIKTMPLNMLYTGFFWGLVWNLA